MNEPKLFRTLIAAVAGLFLNHATFGGEAPAIPWLAPSTPEELKARVDQLRAAYAPFLRSLPKKLDVRTRTELSGPWRSKIEVAQFAGGERPSAPEWWRTDLDDAEWEKTTVPEWRYAMEKGKDKLPVSCILWYRTVFDAAPPPAGRRAFLAFSGVEWDAEVWLNGQNVGRHKGYYEPFRFDVTSLLKGKNTLAVRVASGPKFGQPIFEWSTLPDVPATEQRFVRDFSKSVPGQGIGMLHAGSGFGIHREVFLETTGAAAVSEIFVRGDPKDGGADARIVVETDSAVEKELGIDVQLLPENFDGPAFTRSETRAVPKGAGKISLAVPMPNARLWEPSSPCLYRCRVTLRDGERVLDASDALFGCRSFSIVSAKNPRPGLPNGMFLLNGQPIFLRGTDVSPSVNAMFYWHQDDKLLDAVLLAKAANFNAFRACEHANFAEVRELFDRMGMLSEQDQGGGHNRTNAGYTNGIAPDEVAELARSGTALARVCYNNPGVVLLSLASETHFDPRSLIDTVRAVDPERIIVPISGNMTDWGNAYDQPPGLAIPPDYWSNTVDDFHNYYGWYNQAGQVWKFCKRRAEAARMVTVGEFGFEGLDSYVTLSQHYPPHFKPAPPAETDALIGNIQVQKADVRQLEGLRGEKPANLGQYIEASQTYQADALAEHATGYRLSPKYIAGCFEFHFIDALPAHWPKSIVSHDLQPKKAYFEMAQVFQPVVPLFQITAQGKTLEIWLANDLAQPLAACRVAWSIEAGGKTVIEGEKQSAAPALDAVLVESLDLAAIGQDVAVMQVTLKLSESTGKLLSRYKREVFLKAWRLQDAVFKKK